MRSPVAARMPAAIGVVFGALSVVAGGRVLAGIDHPDYVVLPWLVIYNVAAGLVGIVAGAGVWLLREWAVGLARMLAGGHAVVLVALLAWWGIGGAVASDSLLAMLLRAVLWTSIALVARRARPVIAHRA